jgi:hypothetical protein
MKEELITFETAKLAKERGFNIPCKKVYNTFGESWDSYYSTMKNDSVDSGAKCSAPTQALLQKWLREVHEIYVRPFESWSFDNTLEYCCTVNGTHVNHGVIDKPINRFDSYEEALEIGLQEGLKLTEHHDTSSNNKQ